MSAPAPAGGAPAIDISETFGAGFTGLMMTMTLYGITVLQSYMYYVNYPKDKWRTKSLVFGLWVLETLHVIFACHAMFHYVIHNYSRPAALGQIHWSVNLSILCNLLISTIVQMFFAGRVHALSKKTWLSSLIYFFILAHVVFGLETVAELFILKTFNRLPSITLRAAMPFAVSAVVPDVLIAGSLCYFLHNNRSSFKSTNNMINQLIIYAINRCILTSLVAILEVILFAALPHSFYYLAVDFIIGKLYANSLLATLNTRQSLRGKGYDSETGSTSAPRNSYHLSDLHATVPKTPGTTGYQASTIPTLTVTVDNDLKHSEETEFSESMTKISDSPIGRKYDSSI